MLNAEEIRSSYEEARNREQAVKMEAYMKNKFPFFGLKRPQRNEIQKVWISKAKSMGHDEFLELIKSLWNLEEREMQYVALDLIMKYKRKLTIQDLHFGEYLIVHKSWWDTVDALSTHFFGPLLLKNIPTETTYPTYLLKHENMWMNRVSLIFQLQYKEETNHQFLHDAISQLKINNEFFIQKAIGWALRQYSKYNPNWVENEIKIQNIKGLALREASKYL